MMKVRFKRSSNFKKIGFIFLSAILLVNVILQTNFVKAATNYGSELLKTVELQDADGNPIQQMRKLEIQWNLLYLNN